MFQGLAVVESKVAIMHLYSFSIFHFEMVALIVTLCSSKSILPPQKGWGVLKNQEMYEV